MEPKFQTSFIPKTGGTSAVPEAPIASIATGPQESGGVIGFIAATIFTISVIGAVLVWGGEWYLSRSIAAMDSQLASARSELDPSRIANLTRAEDRMTAIQGLLAKHVALSAFFDKLQTLTIKNVRFTDFSFNGETPKGIEVDLKGEALGYSAVASQADVLGKDTAFSNLSFYDLSLNEQGNVLFSFKGYVDKGLLSYQNQQTKH